MGLSPKVVDFFWEMRLYYQVFLKEKNLAILLKILESLKIPATSPYEYVKETVYIENSA